MIERLAKRLEDQQRADGLTTSGKENRRNAPDKNILDLHCEFIRITGVDLTKIEAVDAMTAFTVISEQGVDMSQFPSAKAITAAAHKLAQRICAVLANGEDYVMKGAAEYEQQYHQQRIRQVFNQAKKLGYQLLDINTGEILETAVS